MPLVFLSVFLVGDQLFLVRAGLALPRLLRRGLRFLSGAHGEAGKQPLEVHVLTRRTPRRFAILGTHQGFEIVAARAAMKVIDGHRTPLRPPASSSSARRVQPYCEPAGAGVA